MQCARTVRRMLVRLFASIILLSCIATAAPDDSVATGASAKSTANGAAEGKVSVFYLTNRQRQEGKPVEDTYSGDRGAPHFGRCEVEFTPIPIVDELAAIMPFYLKSETRAVLLAEQTETRLFWEELGAAAARTSSGSVVLFVHGYNYSFERTCRMAAEMQRYLQDKATVVVFSWPSNGLPSDYVRDQADIEWSVPLLTTFIRRLGDRVGKDNVQIVAHSLGSRGVIFALQRLGAGRAERPAIGNLVLLAPDFDSWSFIDLLPGFLPLAGQISLYASANDTPLKFSRQLNGYPRLGEAGVYLTVVEGIDTIDVSSVGRYQFTGHEYFYFHPLVTADLMTLLSTGARAAERPRLQPKMRDGVRYWEFNTIRRRDGGAVTVDD
jgi:esterase/lipase superfamily enzyme